MKGCGPFRPGLALASLKVERREPPRVASLHGHQNRGIENRARTIAVTETTVGLCQQRQIVGPPCLCAIRVHPLERRLDDRDAFGWLLLSARPSNQHARPL